MLGKRVLNDIISENASRSAAQILEAVIAKIKKFQGDTKAEDDPTVVVVKAKETDVIPQ